MLDWHEDRLRYEHKASSRRNACPYSFLIKLRQRRESERSRKCRIGITDGRRLRGIECVCSVSTYEVNIAT